MTLSENAIVRKAKDILTRKILECPRKEVQFSYLNYAVGLLDALLSVEIKDEKVK